MISPRNLVQIRYKSLLENRLIPVVVSTGPAGTGKSLLACNSAALALKQGHVNRIILTRPAVSVDEQHGFLPGTLEAKMDPWVRPLTDALGRHFRPQQIRMMMEDRLIEVCPLAYMRGRTFDTSWIIADEMQNSTPNQMQMVLTRIGDGSKMVITGDPRQHDRGFETNGLSDLVTRLKPSDQVQHVVFTEAEIERHPVIKEILGWYM
jgi:phosphate starvation-inducible protein PhoH and related proteins